MEKEKKDGIIAEFRKFILRGNVVDLAVGIIIGGAFQSIVNSLIKDVIMPTVSLVTRGKLDFSNWFIALNGRHYATLADAQGAGAATLNYGVFLTALVNFLIMGFVIFILVKIINSVYKERKGEPEPASKKACPFCRSDIPVEATRCPFCTSEQPGEVAE